MPSSPPDYETWAEFRYQIRRYLHSVEAADREIGLTPQQHQLLLAVRGFPGGKKPTIGEVAERLQLRHHSTVELIDRMERGGLVARLSTWDAREVAVAITPRGRRLLAAVTRRMRPELDAAAAHLIATLTRLVPSAAATAEQLPTTAAATRPRARRRPARAAGAVHE